MRCGEQQRAECDTQKAAEIALEYAVNEKSKRNSSTTGAIATAKTMIMIRCSIVREPLKSSTMFCLLEPLPKKPLCNACQASEIKG